MQSSAGDLRQIFAAQRKFDCRPIDRVVSSLSRKPQHGMGDALFNPLGRKFADAVLHLLQALADDADDVDADLWV